MHLHISYLIKGETHTTEHSYESDQGKAAWTSCTSFHRLMNAYKIEGDGMWYESTHASQTLIVADSIPV